MQCLFLFGKGFPVFLQNNTVKMLYSDQIVGDVIANNDIVDVISSYVQLKKSGANYFGICPFHNEKSPSFSVSREKQMFYCFGCGAGGNVLTFIRKYENASFQEALTMLADRAGMKLPEISYSDSFRKQEEKRAELYAINKEAATYYYRLLRSPKGKTGMKYLAGRQLNEQTLHQFGLGYANGSDNDLIRMLREKGFSDERIIEAGVGAYDEKRGLHDKFWNRVMFPILDVRSRVIGFGGRVMGDGKPKYLNSPETEIFDKSRNLYGLNLARRSRRGFLILCEGYMDVISMHQAGFPEAVASLGTSFTEGQAALIKRYVSQVLLAYDSDTAGTTAAVRNMEILRKAGISARVLNLEPYKDPDEFIKALGPEAFEERIKQAENAFFFKIRMLEKNYSMDDPDARTRFHHEIAKQLLSFSDGVERENYLKALAQKYYVREDQLRRLTAEYDRGGIGPAAAAETPAAAPSGPRRKRTDGTARNEALLLTALSEDEKRYARIRGFLGAVDFSPGIARRSAEELFRNLENGTPAAVASILACFETEEEQAQAAALFSTKLADEVLTDQAFDDIAAGIKRASIDRLAEASAEDPAALGALIKAKKELDNFTRKKNGKR